MNCLAEQPCKHWGEKEDDADNVTCFVVCTGNVTQGVTATNDDDDDDGNNDILFISPFTASIVISKLDFPINAAGTLVAMVDVIDDCS